MSEAPSPAPIPSAEAKAPAVAKPLRPWRVWIPLFLLPWMIVARFVPSLMHDPPGNIWMVPAFGPMFIGFAILLWFALVSRARWWERLLGIVGLFLMLVLVAVLGDPSLHGPLFTIMTIPMTLGGFALGAIIFGRWLTTKRSWYALAIAGALASISLFFKTEGVWGNFGFALEWRWNETAEERLLANRGESDSEKKVAISEVDAKAFLQPEWPGFGGPSADGAQHGVKFSDDWNAHPPKELWRADVGPAWSSFAVAGRFLVTQEQRGEFEYVVCYYADTGKEVWTHAEPGRFFESLGGLGPRATPTIHGGYVYALGADGKLLKLDAKNGAAVWKVNLGELAQIKTPMWGYSSSPLVYNDKVIVFAGNEGDEEGRVFALNLEKGAEVWSARAGKASYASAQTLDVLGTKYLALLTEEGLHLYEPDTGAIALNYEWKHNGYRALQPHLLEGNKILIPTGLGTGTRLVEATKKGDKLELEEVWTSLDMKPDFNDLVVHKGYLYGFDNNIFGCVNLADGKRKWKGGRYEKGQAILLADSDLIIVISERGELVLLRATPDKLTELSKITALNDKTWNHPVVVGNRLYVRNAKQAVCYELATDESPPANKPAE